MKRFRHPGASLAALVLLGASCDSGGSTVESSPPTTPTTEAVVKVPVVLDTDMALDDDLALLYLASNPDVALLAVTVSGTGEVLCPIGAQHARDLLAAVGRAEVPVACGRSTPLAGSNEFPLAWRTAASRGYDLDLPDAAAAPGDTDAVSLLTSTITGATHPVTVITLGPLTNLAEAIAAEPTLVDDIDHVVIMGGALTVDGNVVPEGADELLPSEWNFYIDPTADAAVLAAGAPVTLVPLDATNAVPLTQDFGYLVAGNLTSPAAELANRFMQVTLPAYLWDPTAAVAAVAPTLFTTHDTSVVVRTDGADTGRTVVDATGNPVTVVDAPAAPETITEHWLRIVAGLAPGAPLGAPAMPEIVGELTFSFDGTACTVSGPAEVTAGAVRITLDPGTADYAGIVARFDASSTYEETAAYAVAHPNEVAPMVEWYALVALQPLDGAVVSPAIVELDAGGYALICVDVNGTYYPARELVVTG